MLTSLLDYIFPKTCLGCNKTGSYFCPRCVSNVVQGELVCPFCTKLSLGGVTHPVCKRRFGLDGLWSLGLYKPPLRQAIQKLKYRWVTELSEILIGILVEYWAKRSPLILTKIINDSGRNWTVVPVPLHWKRENWRGFNQSALLAQDFAQKLDLEYCNALKRVKNTKPQVTLHASDRKQNIHNAFTISSTINHKLLTKNILLIDDVWTTGSTLKECCYILKKNGAKRVWALTLAR